MKSWIMELCPEIQEWQADLISDQMQENILKAVLMEREACAKQLDALGCDHCAAAIRARGEE